MYFRYEVSHQKGIQELIALFNGNCCTQPRQRQFDKWLSVWNTCYPEKYIVPKKHHAQPTLTEACLSGFLDAEGGFSISIVPRGKTYRVRPRLFCDQKNEKDVLEAIAKAFGAGRVCARTS